MTTAGELLHGIQAEVEAANRRIRPYVRDTPLDYSPGLSRSWGADVWLKLEIDQPTGSFKIRGAMNAIARLRATRPGVTSGTTPSAPQVIEKGYLYIAQPPLFRVKKGKTEKYVQNEQEMQNMLVELAAEDITVPLKGQDVKGKALVPVLKKLAQFERLLEWFERRRKDPQVIRFLLREGVNKTLLKEKPALKDLLKKLKMELPAISIGDIYEAKSMKVMALR